MTNSLSRRDALRSGSSALAALAAASVPGVALAATASKPPLARRFAGRVVLVTGATSGIGEGCAHAFAREGAIVVFCGRREALGRQVQDAINADPMAQSAGGQALFVQADVRRRADVDRLVQTAADRFGTVHVALNNAGVFVPAFAPVQDADPDAFEDLLATNVTGVFSAMRREIPLMLANEPYGPFGLRGVIVNTTSVASADGQPGASAYAASKHALLGLTASAALELAPSGVRVCSFSPGGVWTPMLERAFALGGLTRDQGAETIPIGRINTVDEMAQTVLFLASDAASAFHGSVVDVTGGMLSA